MDRRRLSGELRAVCMRVSRRARFNGGALLPPHQVSVLGKLDGQPHTPRELAEIECVSPPSMTRTLNSLVELGYVTRESDPNDGRQVYITLSPAGRRIWHQVRQQRDEWMLAKLAGLSDEECEVLENAVGILTRVVAK